MTRNPAAFVIANHRPCEAIPVAIKAMLFTTGFTGFHRVNLELGESTVPTKTMFFTTELTEDTEENLEIGVTSGCYKSDKFCLSQSAQRSLRKPVTG